MRLGGGGENSSLHPSFRRKGGAPAPLHSLPTGLAPFSKSKFNLYEAKSLAASTMLHRLVLSLELCTVQTWTGKVDPARKFKRTTAASA